MDSQLFDLMKARFDSVDAKLDAAKESFDSHAATDARYWKMLDEQQAQLSLIKHAFWGAVSIGSAIGGWFSFKH